MIFHPNAKNACYSGNVQFYLELPFIFLLLRIKSCMVWEVYVVSASSNSIRGCGYIYIYIYIYVCVGVCACARAHALNALAQTMIAANSCMTLFLSFSLSLVHQLKVERAIIVCVGTNALVLSQIASNVLIISILGRAKTSSRCLGVVQKYLIS
jgi:hypothetical protein